MSPKTEFRIKIYTFTQEPVDCLFITHMLQVHNSWGSFLFGFRIALDILIAL